MSYYSFSSSKILLAFILLIAQLLQSETIFAASNIIPSDNPEEKVLMTLPLPFDRYNLTDDPIFKMDANGKNYVLALPIEVTEKNNKQRVARLFINGVLKGDFKGMNVADFTENNSDLIYSTSDGKIENIYGLPKFKRVDPAKIKDTAEWKKMEEIKDPDYITKTIKAISETLKKDGYDKKYIDEYVKRVTPEYINDLIAQLQVLLDAKVKEKEKDVTQFYKTSNDSETRIVGIMQNNTKGEYLIIVSPSFAQAKILLFKNGALASENKFLPYFYVAQNGKKTKFAYRGQSINSMNDSEVMVIDNGVEGKKYLWTSQPTYNTDDEVMYIAATSGPKNENDKTKILCKIVVGTSERDVECNDGLFFFLTHSSPYFNFPIISPDGKTIVYPELTKTGKYPDNNYEKGITTPFESRLIVNGKPGDAHPFIDKPFFTDKGMAILSYTAKQEQYVEWNGNKSPIYQAIGMTFTETLGFRGVSPLFAALTSLIRGDLGVEELRPEILVSPDRNGIAFAGYKKGGWDVMQDMKLIGTYKYADQLSYSPDSKHLAFAAVTDDFQPLLNQSFWLGEGSSQSNDIISSVIVDGKTINKHEKVLWLQYSPNGVLTYIGRNQKQYTLYLNGKAVGSSFDRILLPPRFKDGKVEIVGARSDKIIFSKQSLQQIPTSLEKIEEINLSDEKDPAPILANSQDMLRFVKTIKNRVPFPLKPLLLDKKKSTTFYKDKNSIYVLSKARKDETGILYNLNILEGENPADFKIVNSYYAMGKRAYSYVVPYLTTYDFQSGSTTYDGTGIKIMNENAKEFSTKGKYAIDGKNAYFLDERLAADVASFQILNTNFAKDKFSLFIRGQSYLEADVGTFKIINDQCGADKLRFYCFDINGQDIYQMLPMDIASFKYFEEGIAMDKNRVIAKDTVLTELDPTTFKFISHGFYPYLIDKKKVYSFNTVSTTPINDADPATFTLMKQNDKTLLNYAIDKNHVFHYNHVIEGADPKTFSLLENGLNNSENGFAKDSKHVYWNGDIVTEADVKTFKLLEPGKNSPEWYGIDSKHVFHGKSILKNANPKTFKKPIGNY